MLISKSIFGNETVTGFLILKRRLYYVYNMAQYQELSGSIDVTTATET